MLQSVELSLIVPLLNEEESIAIFLERIRPIIKSLNLNTEMIFVDDGSTDRTYEIICEEARLDPSIKLVRFSRNFGKEAALTAGLDLSKGSAVIPIDADLQDPPELIEEFVRLWRDGFDVVIGQRTKRDTDSSIKRTTSSWFYSIFNAVSEREIEPNAGDYRLMSRRVVNATLQLRERNRFMKGVFAWVGFRAISVPYSRPARAAGHTKFNYWKLWNFALDGITSFSTAPLKIWTYVGIGVAGLALIYMLTVFIKTLVFGSDVPGYASLMVVALLLGAVQLLSLGIMGEYLGRLYLETKQRPIYLVSEMVGFTEIIADRPLTVVGPDKSVLNEITRS
jgi:polyisoprenyl-phosphate glycosyltransferase